MRYTISYPELVKQSADMVVIILDESPKKRLSWSLHTLFHQERLQRSRVLT